MKAKVIFLPLLLLSVFIFSCDKKEITENKPSQEQSVYRYYIGEKEGFNVWIVDGALIRQNIFNEFIYGGNDQRYPFVPLNEIWIDNSISAEEFETTLAHEICERNLMMKYGLTYFDAHDSSLMLELGMRRDFRKKSLEHETSLPKVAPIDFDSTQEIEDLPDLIKLKNIYRIPLREINGIKIWVVDGFAVRRDIYADFGFSGNDKANYFIPENEIWIDGAISCEETEYSIALELKEREEMSKGKIYDDAYLEALKVVENMRIKNRNMILMQKVVVKTNPVVRDTGIKL
ncbi:MAG: hypothetical protein HY959_14360 [Ignavibacteriae bacterium]|nr:hypothetical protein [Ignavibacteriota bacterium]